MKRKIFYLLLLVISLVILFLMGPKVSIDLTVNEYHLPEDLNNYLKETESRFSDIRPNTEKKIYWTDAGKKLKTHFSIIYLHGFSATRQETVPVCDILARELQANLFYTRLTGHGRGGKAMATATVNSWINDTMEALTIGRRIGNKVIVIGTSTGATLATWLAGYDRSDDILAFILISPNFGPKNKSAEILTLPWAKYLVPLIAGKTRSWTPVNSLHGQYWTMSYPVLALMPMMGIIKHMRDSDLSMINQPFLFVFSSKDKVVDSRETEKIFRRIDSVKKKKVYIENSQDPDKHVIAGDILSPNTNEFVTGVILDYINQLVKEPK